ncbi:MAG: potassium channel protein [Chloroflexi bacterium]|nr:potassium channel protein [Chloroflexota bacterium]
MKRIKTRYRIAFLILVIYIGLLFLLVEVESGHERASIKTLADAVWYSLVTLATVGYGDYYPVTGPGKAIGVVFLIATLGLLGLLVGKVIHKITDMMEKKKMGLNGTRFENHVIIIGWNSFAHSVTAQLIDADNRVAIITDQKDDVDIIYGDFPSEKVFVLFADLKNVSMLEKAGAGKCSSIFVNLGSDTEKLVAILNIKKAYPNRQLVVALENPDLKETFRNAGVTYVLSRDEIAAKLVSSYIFEPDVADYANDLLSSAREDKDDYDIQEFKVIEGNPFLGKTYGEAFRGLKEKHNVVLIGICKVANDERRLLKLPGDDVKIDLGDYLIVILNGASEKTISSLFRTREGALG